MPDNKKSTGFSTSKLREYYQGKIMPTGGLRNQVLQKKSTADYDVAWSDNVPNTAIKYSITLTSTGWTSEGNVYTQPITVSGIDATSILDLKLDTTAFNAFDTANSKYVYINNNNGSASVVSIGGAPSTDVSVVVIRQDSIIYNGLASIAVSGSFTNEQIVGCAVDITGLTVTATYNDTTTSNVTNSVSVSPATWASSGEQTLTISYSEYGVAKSCTKTCTVSPVVPASLTVNGTPVKQYINESVDVTGLTYTVTYNNGTTATKTTEVTHSPSTWTESGLAKDITFSYTESSTTVTATKTVRVYDEKALTGIACTGFFTNTQRVGSSVDITGLTVMASFNDESTVDVTSSVTKTPSIWDTTGAQTVTLGYTYGTDTKTCASPSVTVEEALVTVTAINYSNVGTQYLGRPFNFTGSTFTAVYSNGTTLDITSSVTASPSSWASSGASQTCTFSYDGFTTSSQTFTINTDNYVALECVSGSLNDNTQYQGTAVNYTGLVFKMRYSSGYYSANGVSPQLLTPDTWGTGQTTQDCLFTYTDYSTSPAHAESVNLTCTNVQVSVIDSVYLASGSAWSVNPQNYGENVNTTGLTVKAHYNNGTEATVPIESCTLSCGSTWSTLGAQTVTISYQGFTATTPSITIADVATGFSVEGNPVWQLVGDSVDTDGLTFYMNYKSGAKTRISASRVTKSISTWANSGLSQSCTFTYSGKTCTLSFNVYYMVCGRIFYDNGSNGATYTFYDQDEEVVSASSISSLRNAYLYIKSGSSSSDRYYVFNKDEGVQTGLTWGFYGETVGITSNTIGSGKTNTATALSGAFVETGSIWEYIENLNSRYSVTNNDWYVGSKAEQDKLKDSGIVTYYDSNYMWSSVEYSSTYAYHWQFPNNSWSYSAKSGNGGSVIAIRSF